MTNFVLLHGAWHGGWCWARVATRLRAAGHSVFSPTFTGVSDRAHLLSPQVDLITHVDDVVRLMDAEDLHDVILVGHSYAGMVVAGVAEQRPDRIRTRVYLDAFFPRGGESAIDLLPDRIAHHYRESVSGPGFGWLIPPRSLEVLGVTATEDIDWLTPRLTPQPWATYTAAVTLTARERDVPAVYIECTSWMRVFASSAERARELGWPGYELDTGHEAMVTTPEPLALLLDQLAV
ncbi:esterase [Streptomyces tauricus]|uniref:alpha/beta fold hydrolase n=1 Tax=Streptomyces tauricus TaxID=68274 RepID=UPI001675B62D|nr:alpha/beta fold hydrolase [Streptomyces tauricus]GHA65105.1 esterase [Streptomyces tauricus]